MLSTRTLLAPVVAAALLAGTCALASGDSTHTRANDRGLPLRDALRHVMNRYGVAVVYVDSDVDGKMANAVCDVCPASGALDSVLAGTGLLWTRIGEQYLVTRPDRLRRHAAAIIAGRVEDGRTHCPLENSIVFLARTTIGTSSAPDGRFMLQAAVTGSFDLVVSLVGYDTRVFHLQLDGGDSVAMTVQLDPRLIEQDQVVVPGERKTAWERDLAAFQKAFIGAGECSEGCRLLNPWVIEFTRRGDTLYASSDSLLWMENDVLGYLMCGIICRFEWDVTADLGQWSVHMLFKELTPESPDERVEWESHRRHLYHGSLMHFLRACINRRVEQEGFELRSGERLQYNERWRVIAGDSVHLVPHAGTRSLEWRFPRWLRVDALAYGWNHAFVRVQGPYALVDSSGGLAIPLSLSVGGRWAEDRAGSLLPLDYVPEEMP